MEESNSILYHILEIAIPLALAALGYGAQALAAFLKSKTKNETIGGILYRLTFAANDAVAYVMQTYVKEIKAAREPDSDGGTSLTDHEKAYAMRQAINAAKSFIGQKGLDEIMKVLGLSEAAVDTLLEKKIEVAVNQAKVSAPLAKRALTAPVVIPLSVKPSAPPSA